MPSEYIKKIRTTNGDKQIDYESLANLPKINNTELKGNVDVVKINQGSSNSGKFLGIGSDGNVSPMDPPQGATEEQAAQIEKNKTDISELSEDIDSFKTGVSNKNFYDIAKWENGGISSSTGENAGYTANARTIGFLNKEEIDGYLINTLKNGYYFMVFEYSSEKYLNKYIRYENVEEKISLSSECKQVRISFAEKEYTTESTPEMAKDFSIKNEEVSVNRSKYSEIANSLAKEGQEFINKERVSRNLISLKDMEESTENGVTWRIKSGTIKFTGTVSNNVFRKVIKFDNPINPGTYWYIPFNSGTSPSGNYAFTTIEGETIGAGSRKKQITTENHIDGITLYYGLGQIFDNTVFAPVISEEEIDIFENYYNYVDINKWIGKNVLCIGDSLTYAKQWQKKLFSELGMYVYNHAVGGIGIIKMVDGGEGADGTLPPLSTEILSGKDMVIFFGGTNDRPNKLVGKRNDLYPSQDTINGILNYAIEKIYNLLKDADNQSCVLIAITPFCQGASSTMGDAFTEMPSDSGQYERDFVDGMIDTYKYMGVPCYDAYANSGINRFTWEIYTNGDGDQLHLNNEYGYPDLGEKIVGFIKNIC